MATADEPQVALEDLEKRSSNYVDPETEAWAEGEDGRIPAAALGRRRRHLG
jgi:hypothetical protein